MMTEIDGAIVRIKAYAAARGWSKSRLAKEAGVGDTTLRHFGRPDWNPTIETLRRLEAIIPVEFTPDEKRHDAPRLSAGVRAA